MKETIKEAADKYFPFAEKIGGETYTAYRGFIIGAKLMKQRMYSEKEVLQLLLRLQQTESYDNLYDWFEQNKKK
jgi:hypothetical protein